MDIISAELRGQKYMLAMNLKSLSLTEKIKGNTLNNSGRYLYFLN